MMIYQADSEIKLLANSLNIEVLFNFQLLADANSVLDSVQMKAVLVTIATQNAAS